MDCIVYGVSADSYYFDNASLACQSCNTIAAMKASIARSITLAHAIETAASHEALPTAQRYLTLTQESLHALGKNGAATSGRAGFESFLQERAKRIIAAAQLPADVRAMARQSAGISRWMVTGVLLGALALGFAGHAITDPHRVDLLSPSLIGIVLWNVLVYLILLLTGVRGLIRRKPMPVQPLAPTQVNAGNAAEAGAAPTGWWQKMAAKKSQLTAGTGLRKMVLNYERNWWQLSQRPRRAQWVMCMHLGAAMLALGALASLWVTGLTREYQVGWESTFLSPAAVQSILNVLFSPLTLLGAQGWSLEAVHSLQGWVSGGTPEIVPGIWPALQRSTAGESWVLNYTLLLLMLVVAPRLLLALWQGLRVYWLNRHMTLPLQQAYFQKLQRDWAGRATSLQVQPYSLDITSDREAALLKHVAQNYGAGAQLTLLPVLAYGSPLPDANQGPAQQVLLLNLAATPEAEIHGALLSQVFNLWGAQTDVWLWAADFRARNTGAPARVQEREHLWLQFVRDAGLNATLVPSTGLPAAGE